MQEEDAPLLKESNNTGPTGLFEEHPRPGLRGELLGDCKLLGVTGGADRWQVRRGGQVGMVVCRLGGVQGMAACPSGLAGKGPAWVQHMCLRCRVVLTDGSSAWGECRSPVDLQESAFGKGGQRWLFNSFQSALGGKQSCCMQAHLASNLRRSCVCSVHIAAVAASSNLPKLLQVNNAALWQRHDSHSLPAWHAALDCPQRCSNRSAWPG